MIADLLKYSVLGLWKRKLRSSLTILSILVGIAAIFALVSFGQGIDRYVKETAKEQGMDKLLMMPKDALATAGSSNIAFKKEDIEFIRKINGVSEAAGIMIATVKIKFKDYKEKYTYAFGLPAEGSEIRLMEETFNLGLENGRSLKKGDALKAVLGHNYRLPNKLFEKPIDTSDTVLINDVPVEVIGFYQEVGNPQDDSQIYLSIEGAKEVFKKEDYEYIVVRSAAGQDPTELADKIKERFRKHKGQKKGEEDFFVQTFEDAIATFTSIVSILNGVLVLIALISVVVAAVNIMNTMYTSVLERTSEIGVMKAIGSRNNEIRTIFVIESGILGLAGGILGVGLGYGIAKVGEHIATGFDLSMLRPYFPWWLVAGCLVFAFCVGAFSGLLPAIRASKLSPVDALRYE